MLSWLCGRCVYVYMERVDDICSLIFGLGIFFFRYWFVSFLLNDELWLVEILHAL